MSITDELREYAAHAVERGDYMAGLTFDLDRIADRIDAEHERLMQEQPFTIDMVPMTDEDMAEHGWVRLPKDADGVPIRVGDVIAYKDNTKPKEVVALVPPSVVMVKDGPRYADMCRHYHEPTVEDVLGEFFEEVGDGLHTLKAVDTQVIIAKYAAKLRLAGDAE